MTHWRLYLTVVASTFGLFPSLGQSWNGLTSIANGNVQAAVVTASMLSRLDIVLLTTLPFTPGHLARRRIGRFVGHRKRLPGSPDRASIMRVACTVFSAAVFERLWIYTSLATLLSTLVECSLPLALVMPLLTWAARRLGVSPEDGITIVFCDAVKSMASGTSKSKTKLVGQLGGLGAPG